MRIGLLGLGRMGRAVEAAALEAGHEVGFRYDPALLDPLPELGPLLAEAIPQVLIDFTTPEVVPLSVQAALEAGLPIVVGTTGWEDARPEIEKRVVAQGGTLLHAPNFSVGMALFTRLVTNAAHLFNRFPEYDPYLLEHHHRGKADAPSGTALRLGELLLSALEGKSRVLVGAPQGQMAPEALQVTSVRAGHEFGSHLVGFDGPADLITLRHEARSRQGFARGAILAAEWILGKTGIFTFEDVLFGSADNA